VAISGSIYLSQSSTKVVEEYACVNNRALCSPPGFAG